MRIVKITVCALRLRSALVLRIGRMSSIAAPVVPMNEAMTAPAARKVVLIRGVARRSPARKMPPETTKSASSRVMNCAYSTSACTTEAPSPPSTNHAATGSPSTSASTS